MLFKFILFLCSRAKAAAQALMKACQAFKDLSGQTAAEEVAEELAALFAELDSMVSAVQSICDSIFFLATTLGNTLEKNLDRHANEDAKALLALSTKNIDAEARNLALCAKSNPKAVPTKLHSATAATAQVVNAVKTLVSTLPEKQQQTRLLNSARNLNQGMLGNRSSAINC